MCLAGSVHIMLMDTRYRIAGEFGEHYTWQIAQKTQLVSLIWRLCYCGWMT